MRLKIAFALSLGAINGFALAQQTPSELVAPPEFANPNPEDLKHGAVLCTWIIYLAMKEVGDHCYPEKDTKLQALLDESIARIDQFIIDNAPTTREELETSKSARISSVIVDRICSKDALQMYEALRKASSDRLSQSVTDLLSVPRKPVMNPCV